MHLSQSAVLNGNGGSATVKASTGAQSALSAESRGGTSAAGTQSPVLVLSSRNEAILEVSMHLRTGRMQLRLPPQQAHSLSHESSAAPLLKKVRQCTSGRAAMCPVATPQAGDS